MTNVLLISMIVPLALFMIFYGRYSPWTSTVQGITLMFQKGSWIVLLVHFLAASWFPAYSGSGASEIVRNVILLVLAAEFWMMFIGLRLGQTAARPVSKKQGAGYVQTEDLEKTRPRLRKR